MKTLLKVLPDKLLSFKNECYLLDDDYGVRIGGSSFVYKAEQIRGSEIGKYFIIKELCPSYLIKEKMIKRVAKGDEKGYISIPKNLSQSKKEECEKIFNYMKTRAKDEQKRVSKLSLESKNNHPRFFYYGTPKEKFGTLYTIISTEKGETLDSKKMTEIFKNKNFIYICKCIIEILDSLKIIHKKYMHLDISPDNIFIPNFDDDENYKKIQLVRIIDYNSAIEKELYPEIFVPSFKEGYSAKELITYPLELSESTDLYSVAAIFFKLLFDRPPEPKNDLISENRLKLINNSRYLKGASEPLINELNIFFANSLSERQSNRFKNVEEMRNAIEKLMELNEKVTLSCKPKNSTEYFVGRIELLEKIHNTLQENNFVILEGMGGIGKTELVKRYIEIYQKDYKTIQFVNFNGNLRSTIIHDLEFDNINKYNYLKEAKYYFKISELKKYKDDTLIIIDNFSILNDECLRCFDEIITGKEYRVIFTSREKQEHIPEKNRIDVKNMNDKDAFQLFYKYYYPNNIYYEKLSPEIESVIRDIIELVNNHTMTIMLLATALRKQDDITPEEMLNELRKSINIEIPTTFSIDKEGLSKEKKEMYQHLINLFDMAEINKNEKKDNLIYIMRNMTIIPGFKRTTFYDLTELSKFNNTNKSKFNDIDWLIERRWIQFDEKTKDISLHSVISDVVAYKLKPNSQNCENLIKNLIKITEKNIEKTYIEWNESDRLLELACKRIEEENSISSRMYFNYAFVNHLLSKNKIAIEYFEKAGRFYKTISGKEDIELVKYYNYFGMSYSDIGDFDKALIWFDKALKIGRYDFIYNNKAIAFSRQDKLYEALEMYHELRIYYEEKYGKDDTNTAASYSNIGKKHYDLNENETALKWYNDAKKIYEKHNIMDTDVATLYHNIGVLYSNQDNIDEAFKYFEKSLNIKKNELGDEHLITAETYYELAILYNKNKYYKDALELYQKVMNIRIKMLPEDHLDIAGSYNNIATCHYEMDEYLNALDEFNKAKDIYKKRNTENSFVAITYINIGNTLSKLKRYSEAINWYYEAVLILEKLPSSISQEQILGLVQKIRNCKKNIANL